MGGAVRGVKSRVGATARWGVGGNSGGGGNSWGGGGSSTSKNRSSQLYYKSPKQFELKQS